MTRLRHWLIAAAFLPTMPASALAAGPLEGLASDADDSGPAAVGGIQGKAPSVRLGWRDAIPASHAVQPVKHMEFGWGLSTDAIRMNWYGVYLKSLDRVTERNTIYGLLRESPRFGANDSKTQPALCCQISDTVTSLEQYEKKINAAELVPTFFVFGLLRNKGYDFKLDDGWKLQAGIRHMQYGGGPLTKLGFVTVERYGQSFRTSYSYQLERGNGTLAPSHVLQLDYLYGPHNSIGVSFANGREFADFGQLGILNTQVRNVTLRGQHWFKPDWALTFQAGYDNHGSLPAHKGVRIGLRHSF